MTDSFKAVTWNPFNGTPVGEVRPILREQLKQGVSIFLLQEAQADFWPELLADHGLVFFLQPPQYVVAWTPRPWTCVSSGGVRLTEQFYFREGGSKKVWVEAAAAILCDPLGRSLDCLSYHLPPRVQVPESERPERRFLATLGAMASLSARAAESQTRAVLYGGDDNVDENTGFGADTDQWLPLLGKATGLRQVQAPEGTHGKRQIDDFRIQRRGAIKAGPGWVADGGGDHKLHGREFVWRDV